MISVLQIDAGALANSINTVWVLTVSFLIFFMQPGFMLLEAGQIRSKNVSNLVMKNMFDWSLGVLGYFILGLGIAGLVGSLTSPGPVSLSESFAYINTPSQWIGWLFGAVFAMTAATIVSGAVAGRIKFKSYVTFSVFITVFIYPVVQGLTWQGGLLAEGGFLGQALGVGYLDFAGGTIVHMVGGIAGLTAAYVLGPRSGRFDEDGNSKPIPGHSVLFAVVGTFMLAFGWYGFNVGTQATVLSESGAFFGEELGRVALTTTLAMGGGAVASSVVTMFVQGKPDPLFTANGLLGGLVAITSGAAYVTWWGGLLIGVLGGLIVFPTYKWTVEGLGIDDVCGVFAVHGAAGGVGVILIPFFGVAEAGGWAFLGLNQLLMQVIGVLVIGTWTVLLTMGAYLAIDSVLGLRYDEETEKEGMDQIEHNIVSYPEFITDGGTDTADASSQGTQETNEATMWRGEKISTGDSSSVLDGAGIDTFPDPTIVVDTDNTITALNPEAVRFFGTVEDEAIGATPPSLVAAADEALNATDDAISSGQEIRDLAGEITVGGETIPITVTATPLSEDGEIAGALATIRNNAGEVARERRRQTVEEYREAGLEQQREKLSELADGSLDIERGVPDPPDTDIETVSQLHSLFDELDSYIVETTDNVSSIVEKLPGQSEELAETSDTLSDSSDQVADAVDDIDELSSRIESEITQLAEHIDNANTNVSDLSASIEEISASTSEIETQSREAADLTQEGVDEMTDAVTQIRSATEHSEAVAAEIDSLEEKMDAVAEIVDIIQDIASQTNMLALNANIEAANADAGGSGFAVVADEVKALAEETQESASDIDEIITDVQEQTGQVVETIREANTEIEAGTDAVEDAVGTVERIQERVHETNNGISEISAAVSKQADNTEQVSASMQEVTTMIDEIKTLSGRISSRTDEQAQTIGRVASLASNLNTLASDVHSNIDTFDLEADIQTGAVGR
jgi:Amt family ammonium transporter